MPSHSRKAKVDKKTAKAGPKPVQGTPAPGVSVNDPELVAEVLSKDPEVRKKSSLTTAFDLHVIDYATAYLADHPNFDPLEDVQMIENGKLVFDEDGSKKMTKAQGNMWIAAQETYRNSTKIQEETLKRAQNGEVPIKLVDVPGWKKVAPASDATYEDSDEDMD